MKNITSLLIWRGGLNLMSDKDTAFIFKHFIIFANELQAVNGLMKLKGEIPTTRILLDIALKRLRDGKIFVED